jgi:hypothetical protein
MLGHGTRRKVLMPVAHRLPRRIWFLTRHRAADHHQLRPVVLIRHRAALRMREIRKRFTRCAPFRDGRESVTNSKVWG